MTEGSEAPLERARIVVDDQPIPFEAGDSVALAVLRTGAHPARGGTLCLAGDCGNCLAQVDGIAYVRTCQTPALPGLVVRRHPPVDMPPLPVLTGTSVTSSPPGREIEVRRVEIDVAIVGGGASGLAARAEAEHQGRTVLVLDAGAGDEVVAIYAGGMLVVRTRSGMLHVTAQEIVVATGAAELHPVCAGNQLEGLFTARAAARLTAAGVDLAPAGGTVASIGAALDGEPATALTALPGRLVRF